MSTSINYYYVNDAVVLRWTHIKCLIFVFYIFLNVFIFVFNQSVIERTSIKYYVDMRVDTTCVIY